MKSKGRWERKGIETGNGGGSIDCAARSQALPSHRCHGWTDGRARLRATGAGQESSSSLIPQERELRDILVLLLSAPPKRGEGRRRFFYVPHSGHVGHRRGFCFPSLSRAPLIDVSIRARSRSSPVPAYISIQKLGANTIAIPRRSMKSPLASLLAFSSPPVRAL